MRAGRVLNNVIEVGKEVVKKVEHDLQRIRRGVREDGREREVGMGKERERGWGGPLIPILIRFCAGYKSSAGRADLRTHLGIPCLACHFREIDNVEEDEDSPRSMSEVQRRARLDL